MTTLENATALVTGGGRGLGKARTVGGWPVAVRMPLPGSSVTV